MPYMDVKIVGSGSSGMRKAFERNFDTRMGAGVKTTYEWSGRQPEMPRGLAKVMDILANAAMNTTPSKPEPKPEPTPGDTGQQVPPGDTGQQVPPGNTDQRPDQQLQSQQDRFCKK
jgi:hypothetical protein